MKKPRQIQGEGFLSVKAPQRQVRFALAVYLLLFTSLNIAVWSWFLIHRHGPHHFPLGERSERFGDLLRFTGKAQVWKDPRMEDRGSHLIGSLYPKNYPPFADTIYLFLLQVCAPYAVPVFSVIVMGSVAVAAFYVWLSAKRFAAYRWYIGVAIFATALLGWGTESTLMRANIEGVMWIAVCAGAALYGQRRYRAAGAAFAIACCVKPYPVAWLALMARYRKWRGVLVGAVIGAVVTAASLTVFNLNPIRAYRIISAPASNSFFSSYIVSFRPADEMTGDHSIFQTMKALARVLHYHSFDFPAREYKVRPNDPLAIKLYHAYLVILAVLTLVICWRLWNKPVLNQMFALASASTLLPFIAGDYTLNVLLIPMGFFVVYLLQDVAEGRTRITTGHMLCYLVPYAWIMGTTPMWNLHGVLKCMALIGLLTASMFIPLPSTVLGDLPRADR